MIAGLAAIGPVEVARALALRTVAPSTASGATIKDKTTAETKRLNGREENVMGAAICEASAVLHPHDRTSAADRNGKGLQS